MTTIDARLARDLRRLKEIEADETARRDNAVAHALPEALADPVVAEIMRQFPGAKLTIKVGPKARKS